MGLRWILAGILPALFAHAALALPSEADIGERAKAAFRERRYAEAEDMFTRQRAAGGDTAGLTYNIAVSAYRSGNYSRARKEFSTLTAHEKLGMISRYNLGLVAVAQGQRARAVERFNEVLNGHPGEALSELARRAIDEYGAPDAEVETNYAFTLGASVGTAFDSNVYRTPDDDYVNLALRSAPLVATDRQSGFFSPIRLRATLGNENEQVPSWQARYYFRSRIYWDNALDNANRFNNTLYLGRHLTPAVMAGAKHRLYLGAVFRLVSRNDVDRDDGVDREIRGFDASGRLSYFSHGVKASHTFESGGFRAVTQLRIEKRNYRASATSPEYDHTKYTIGTWLRYRISKSDRAYLKFNHTKRDYSERSSRDLAGDTDALYPRREYIDDALTLSLKHRFSRRIRFGLEYAVTNRDDQFEGYDDYVRQGVEAQLVVRPFRSVHVRGEAAYTHTNYPRAFAFNNPAAKEKTRDVVTFVGEAEYRFNRTLSFLAAISYRDDRTTDPRFRYDRILGTLGLQASY